MIYESAIFSLFIQFIVGIIHIFGFNIDIPQDKNIFKDLLKVEFGVQVVEFIFYIWMILNFKNIKNITPYRYVDWIITTPVMLTTLITFLDQNRSNTLLEYLNKNKNFISQVAFLNICMLGLGLMGELEIINYNLGIILGFIPFIIYFKLIYDKYIKDKKSKQNEDTIKETKEESVNKEKLYWFFFVIWSLYGIVAFLPYEEKNTSFNILDLLSKNLFGVFLVIYLWNSRTNK